MPVLHCQNDENDEVLVLEPDPELELPFESLGQLCFLVDVEVLFDGDVVAGALVDGVFVWADAFDSPVTPA